MASSKMSRKRRRSDAAEPVAKQVHIKSQGELEVFEGSVISSPLTSVPENVDEIASHDNSAPANQPIQALDANIAPTLPAKELVHEALTQDAATSHGDPGRLDPNQAFANGQSQASENDNISMPTSTATPDFCHGSVNISEGTTSPDFEAYYKHMDRIQALSLLENIAVQVVDALARSSFQGALMSASVTGASPGQTFKALVARLNATKDLYGITGSPFMDASDAPTGSPEEISAIRKVNLATFLSGALLGEVGFYYLHEHFLDVLIPEGGRVLKVHGALFLDFKTQAYISALLRGARPRAQVIDEMFPANLDVQLLQRRPGKQLTPGESFLVQRAKKRREHLLSVGDSEEALAALPQRYVWADFLRELGSYVNRNLDQLLGGANAKTHRRRSSLAPTQQLGDVQPTSNGIVPKLEDCVYPNDEANLRLALEAFNQSSDDGNSAFQDAVERAAQAAQATLRNETLAAVSAEAPPALDQQPSPETPGAFNSAEPSAPVPSETTEVASTPPGQSAPTQVLYEQARLAASSKAASNNRRAALPSQRRPWTPEEERALMAGLDRVKGPYWSQILAMFGAGGTINEALKDRTQVQLKDKARNLKLFFLKNDLEVPYYLRCVTGDMGTRAPRQVARMQAKDATAQQHAEDRAHVQGVLALANGVGGFGCGSGATAATAEAGGVGGDGGSGDGGAVSDASHAATPVATYIPPLPADVAAAAAPGGGAAVYPHFHEYVQQQQQQGGIKVQQHDYDSGGGGGP